MKKTLPFSYEQIQDWAGKYPTPFYVYDEAGIRETVKSVNDAFGWNPGFREYFAVKPPRRPPSCASWKK